MLTSPDAEDVLARLEADAQIEAGMAFAGLVAEYFAATREGDGPVSTALSAETLYARFEEPPPPDGRPLAEVVERLRRDVLPDCNRLAHPMSMGHQVSAPLPVAVWMEALTAAVNQSAAVFEMSPTGTAVETSIVRWLCGRVGFGPAAGGTFTSGGTEATFAALLAARSALLPRVWQDGVAGADAPLVVCGEHAHYAVSRAVGQMGLGLRNMPHPIPRLSHRSPGTPHLPRRPARLGPQSDGRRGHGRLDRHRLLRRSRQHRAHL